MKYAIKNYIGKNKNTRKTKAKTTASTVGRICRLDEAGQKRFGNSERPTEICSDKSTSDGFLKCTFLPKLKEKHQNGKRFLSIPFTINRALWIKSNINKVFWLSLQYCFGFR